VRLPFLFSNLLNPKVRLSGQSDDPLGEKLIDFMLAALGIPVFGKAAGRLLEEIHFLGNLPNQEASGVGRDSLSGKLGLYAALAEAFRSCLVD
jgi:hypothetical protein